ncbi:Alpha/Beta hydrolase protein [Suillus americanus]|nr:Alpha/Beta hydrolase protein [Suillus americanus]
MSLFKQGQLANIARSEELLSEARGISFVVPSTETEKESVKIYAGIFNLVESEVSVSDNFFEIGGTSLDAGVGDPGSTQSRIHRSNAIRLKREGEENFGLPDIPAVQILEHPVLSGLAHYVDSLLSKGTQAEEYDRIVPFSVTGNKTPFFFVHPGVGEVLIFVNLAKYFHNERPFYAFRARGFDSGHPKRIQATGPYAIAGYSYGGAVAFEVARRLKAVGEEVKFFAPINIPPHKSDRMRELDWTAALLNLSAFLGFVLGCDADDLHPSVSLLTRQQQLEFVWKFPPPERIIELQLTLEKLDKWTDVAMSLVNCGVDYIPTGSVSAVDVFYNIPFAESNVDWLDNQLKACTGWSRGEWL